MISALIAEVIGTFVFFSAILWSAQPIPIVVGLLAAIYAFGAVSGGHFNPGVSFMMFLKGEPNFNLSTLIGYVIAQLLGATIALLWFKGAFKGTQKTA